MNDEKMVVKESSKPKETSIGEWIWFGFCLIVLVGLLTVKWSDRDSDKVETNKQENTKQEKPDEPTFKDDENGKAGNEAFNGLIHTFSDSGKLLETTTYHEGIILSQIHYLNPPVVNTELEGVRASNYYHNDLPEYGKLINEKWSISEKQELLKIFKSLKFTESNPCDIFMTSKHVNPKDNKCNQPTADNLGSFIKTKAPWIDISHLAYSKKRINGIPTLFVFISSIDKEDHPYMVIYQFTFPLDDIFIQFYGPFLNGDYHGVNKVNDNDTLFIKYESCMECHPWVYLQAIQFNSDKNIGVPLHFNYSFGEPFWSPRMEYELPGMGHSVGGSVETRIISTGPFSIIQKFSLFKDDKIEWWGFNCTRFRCKTDIRKGDLPKDWVKEWRTGEPMKRTEPDPYKLTPDRDTKGNLHNIYLACKAYWADDLGPVDPDSLALCSMDIIKDPAYGFIQSSNVVIVFEPNNETQFLATASHEDSEKVFVMNSEGSITEKDK